MFDWLNSFRNRMTLFFGVLSLVICFGFIYYVYNNVSQTLYQVNGEKLKSLANSMSNSLARGLVEREREIELISHREELTRKDWQPDKIRRILNQVQNSYLHYAWIGVTDTQGKITIAANKVLENQNASERPWFIHGSESIFVGDVHNAQLLAKIIQKPNAKEPVRFVDFTAPIHSEDGEFLGVVATHANWDWAKDTLASVLNPDAVTKGIQAYILDTNNQPIYPYSSMAGKVLPENLPKNGNYQWMIWPDNNNYLTGLVEVKASIKSELGWKVLIRQPMANAWAPINALYKELLWLSLIAAILLMALAYWLAGQFSRPIEKLAQKAKSIELGSIDTQFQIKSQLREVISLTHSIQSMTNNLNHKKTQVEMLNKTLESKVRERTLALELANHQLHNLARHDNLTKLRNRLSIDEKLNDEFTRWQRNGKAFSVLLLDIDYFKNINDKFGHETGDKTLVRLANILMKNTRTSDSVGRFGGEEFLIILPETDINALELANKIRKTIQEDNKNGLPSITVSIGVAVVNSTHKDTKHLIRSADTALYQAKSQGRNQVVLAENNPKLS